MIQLDNLDPQQKRSYVVAGCVVGLALSVVTSGMRGASKISVYGRLQAEDWFMAAGLLFGTFIAICLLYALSTGLGFPQDTLTALELRNFLITLWTVQRLDPIALFCVKFSIILFYVRLFPTRTIYLSAWAIGTFTVLWLVAMWFATFFECTPFWYFWQKAVAPDSGTCLPNPLVNIGLTGAVLSCVGDLTIFSMPLPVVLRLQVNKRRKVALAAIFMLGLFVVCTSFIRWISLLGLPNDITSSQVEAGVWTYLEISIGITCGNLPTLGPLFKRWLRGSTADNSYYQNGEGGAGAGAISLGSRGARRASNGNKLSSARTKSTPTQRRLEHNGFTRMGTSGTVGSSPPGTNESPTGSEIELRSQSRPSVAGAGPGVGAIVLPSGGGGKPADDAAMTKELGQIMVMYEVNVQRDEAVGEVAPWGPEEGLEDIVTGVRGTTETRIHSKS